MDRGARWAIYTMGSQRIRHDWVTNTQSLLYFGCWQPWYWGGLFPKANSPVPTDKQWASVFKKLRERVICRNSMVSSDSHLEISHAVWQFLVPRKFVPISLRPVLRIVAAYVKESNGKAEAEGDEGLIPGWGRSPGGGSGNPLHYSCLKNPMCRGVWLASVHRVSRSWTWLSD